jgi:ubiquitin-protein ligase E3 C
MDEANATIRAFWSVVSTFSKEDMAALLKFVTSCARPPLLGFRELNPRFAIRAAGTDETRLPTSSTCVNLLKLPEYTDEANLRQSVPSFLPSSEFELTESSRKLLYAISSGAGFDLS